MAYVSGDDRYDEWTKQVDFFVEAALDMSLDEIPDLTDLGELYAEGATPRAAAKMVVRDQMRGEW